MLLVAYDAIHLRRIIWNLKGTCTRSDANDTCGALLTVGDIGAHSRVCPYKVSLIGLLPEFLD